MTEQTDTQTITRVDFALKLAHNGALTPIDTSTAERFIAGGSTRGRVGVLMRRESGPAGLGEWRPQDGQADA